MSSPDAPATPQVPFRELWRNDATLRTLLVANSLNTLGRGVFFTLTALYLTLILHFDALSVGLALTIAGGVGVVASLLGGHLADRFSSRRMLIVSTTIQGLGLCAYSLIHGFGTLLLIASIVTAAQQFGSSVRSAAIGRAFVGEERVRIRAIMYTITNVGIGVGTAIAAIPLAIATPESYRLTMVLAGLLLIAGALHLRGLDPVRVDSPRSRRGGEFVPDDASTGSSPTVASQPATSRGEDGGSQDEAGAQAPAVGQNGAATRQTARSPYRDVRYLTLTLLSGLFAIQYGLFGVAVPLWVVNHTEAPSAAVSVLLIINTAVVASLSVRLSRGTGDLRGASKAINKAGWLMAAACGLWAWGGFLPVWAALGVLILASISHSLAEVLSSAGEWSLSYELAPPAQMGAYQGVFGTGYALANMVAPVVVTVTAINMGPVGWGLLAAGFLASALGLVWLVRRARIQDASGVAESSVGVNQ